MTTSQQEKVVALARSLIGKPYKWGATPEEAPEAFDCSSFTQYVLRQVSVAIPRSSILQAADTNGASIVPAPDLSNLLPGDLLFMRGTAGHYNDELFPGRDALIGHVALYVGHGNIVHARSSIRCVGEQPLRELRANPRYAVQIVRRY